MTLPTFTHTLLNMDLLLYLAYVFWASVGVLLNLLLNANQQITTNKSVNNKGIFASLILILVAIRFSKALIGLEPNAFSSFIIGLCSNHLVSVLKDKISSISEKINVQNK